MFSQEDRRRLEAIERQLRAEDPDLERRLHWPAPASRRKLAAAIVLVTIGTVGVPIGLGTFNVVVLALSVLFLSTGWLCLHNDLSLIRH